MILAARRTLVLLLAVCFSSYGLPQTAAGDSRLTKGVASADDAASMPSSETPSPAAPSTTVPEAAAMGQPVLAFGALNAYADPDTSDFEFPEDGNKHLVRDITMWVIAAAFVAFFIVKVFIEEDDEEAPDDTPPGKRI